MKTVRSAAAAIVATALAATGVLATTPQSQAPTTASSVSVLAHDKSAVGGTNDNHGGAVSALARTIGEQTSSGAGTTSATTPSTPHGSQGTHGAAVRVVAHDKTAVGGTNNNHGGAVSAVARGTHGPSATHGKSTGKSQSGAHPASH